MEFIQFHPTGMVWPPSVRGHSGDRGRARRRRRPAEQRGQALHVRLHPRQLQDRRPPTTRKRAGAIRQGDKNARRPPELLTRDHVARCINREVKAGRGSPHGGVFLDIAWIKEKIPNARRAHQEEAAVHVPPVQGAGRRRHHQGADGSRPDDALHHGRHPRGRATRRCRTVPGLFAAAKCAAGLHGANRLGGNSLSDLLVFGKRAGEYAAKFAKENSAGRRSIDDQIDAAASARARAVRPRQLGREPVRRQRRPAGHDAEHLSASCAWRTRCSEALEELEALQDARREREGVAGNREYNPGWHTALDLHNLLTVSEAITRCGASSARRAAAATSATTIPDKSDGVRQVQHRHRARRRTARWSCEREPHPARCRDGARSRVDRGDDK